MHTARVPAPHNHSHHNQCRTPYEAVHALVLLMMGIMMPETCWDKSLLINIRLVASCWFLSLHPTFMMHGHKSLKKKGWRVFILLGDKGDCYNLHSNRSDLKEDKVCWKSSKNVEKRSKMKWKSSKSVVKWSEVKCSIGKGVKKRLYGKSLYE